MSRQEQIDSGKKVPLEIRKSEREEWLSREFSSRRSNFEPDAALKHICDSNRYGKIAKRRYCIAR